ncbi:hypothetical protein F5883DRAFT_259498 [Diaporthe sp. PMI_573]|nr:hypothetical protein F5883DRAFT_259498 [Diaporthaceae sp. PMI_573]
MGLAPILICPHTPTGRLHTQAGKPLGSAWRALLSCPVLAADGVSLPPASLGLALPHLEGGCWPDASLRRGSDRPWTALSQHGPQSFLPVAWPTSVPPKSSEWIWRIYYLFHLYQLSACEAHQWRAFSLFCRRRGFKPGFTIRSTHASAFPSQFRPVPSLPPQSSPVRTGRSISRHLSP